MKTLRAFSLLWVGCFLLGTIKSHGQTTVSARRLEEIKVRRADLEKALIAELHRLNRLLSVHDQILQMQAASGSLTGADAASHLKRKGLELFERSFSEGEYESALKDLQTAGERFFSMANQKIEFASRWPADKSENEYQQLSRTELAQARLGFEQARQQPLTSVKFLEQANKTLGWSQGHRALPAELRFFSGQSQRVVQALAEARVKTFMELSRPALPPEVTRGELGAAATNATTVPPGVVGAVVATNELPIAGYTTMGADIAPRAIQHYTRAVQLSTRQQWREAEVEYRAALQIDAREGLFHLGLGHALMGLARVTEAEQSYRASAQARPALKEAFQGWGGALYQLQRYDESVRAYQEFVRLAPQLPEAHGALAFPLLMLRRWPEGEATLRAAIRLAPAHSEYWTGLGNLYYQSQRFAEAAQAYQQALLISPTNAQNALFAAMSWEAGRQTEQARALFRQAYQLDANNAQVAIEFANSLARTGNWTDAEPVYAQAARLNPKDPDAWRGIGHAKMGANQFAEAEKAYRGALQINPQMGVLHADLAGALFRQNRADEARTAAQKAAQLGYRQHWVFDALGL